MALNDYGFYNNGQQLVSVKQQLLDRQAEIDKEQDEIIQEIIDHDYSGGTDLILVTYDELVELRDNGQLSKGTWYRITDYECTTTQEGTASAGHPFDIIVLATSEKTLSEEARAIQHEGDYDGIYVDDGDHCVYTGRKVTVHFYDVTKELYFWQAEGYASYEGYYSELSLEELKQLTQEQLNDTLWTWIDALAVIAENEIDAADDYVPAMLAENPLVYSFDSYFSKCNLNAWKIWYCLDNDSSRFAWASLDGAVYDKISPYIPDSNKIINGVLYYAFDYINGDYVIYSDKRYPMEGDILYVYEDGEMIEDDSFGDYNYGKGVIYRMIDEWGNDCPYDFKNILFTRYKITECEKSPNLVGKYSVNGVGGVVVDDNHAYMVYTFSMIDENDNNVYDVSVFQRKYSDDDDGYRLTKGNVIKNAYEYYYAGDNYYQRIILNDNIFVTDTSLSYNYFFGYDSNTFGNDCYYNTFGNSCNSNTFGNSCNSNTFGNDCNSNTFGNDCRSNAFGNSCYSNTFGNICYSNAFGNSCYSNTFGNICYSNAFGNGCNNNTFGNSCNYNTFGNSCYSNAFGNGCNYNTFGKSGFIQAYFNYITFDNGNMRINLICDKTTSSSNKCQNIHVLKGVNSSISTKEIYIPVVAQSYELCVGLNKYSGLVIYNPTEPVIQLPYGNIVYYYIDENEYLQNIVYGKIASANIPGTIGFTNNIFDFDSLEIVFVPNGSLFGDADNIAAHWEGRAGMYLLNPPQDQSKFFGGRVYLVNESGAATLWFVCKAS